MKKSYGEGLATHTGPESCVGAGDRAGEALTGEGAGWVSSREIHAPRKRVLRGADAVEVGGRRNWARRHREARRDPARSKTPCMHGSISHGNREIPRLSAAIGAAERIGNPKGSRR
jgi:hypothetical protein